MLNWMQFLPLSHYYELDRDIKNYWFIIVINFLNVKIIYFFCNVILIINSTFYFNRCFKFNGIVNYFINLIPNTRKKVS